MKPKFFMAALLLCSLSFSAFAQKSKSADPFSKLIRFDEGYSSLIIDEGISVVLTEGNSNEIIIKGVEKSVKKVTVKVDDGRLVLTNLQPGVQSDVKVYVPASFLNKVNINGASELTSASILNNPKLRVIVAGEGRVHLRSNGKVTVEGTDEFDFIRVVR